MTFPLDKLGLINTALALCGDNLCAVVEDGSDEWNAASAAYETAIEYMYESHDWKGITLVAVVPRAGTPSDPAYSDAYNKPADCIHIIWVRVDDVALPYSILGNQIVINPTGTLPTSPSPTPGTVTVKYVSSTNAGPESGRLTRMFMTALIAFVRAGIYSGLQEDDAAEARWLGYARQILQEARTRSDQEAPKRSFFVPRMAFVRRGFVRRG